MAQGADGLPETVEEAIDAIEAGYDFMLAFAAQGREPERDDPMGIRGYLQRACAGMDVLSAAKPSNLGVPNGPMADATEAMLKVMREDAAKARAAFQFVLAQAAIGSQMIDNLNASIHIRALLTDVFLIDESLKSANS